MGLVWVAFFFFAPAPLVFEYAASSFVFRCWVGETVYYCYRLR
jgi:hypothetical protein